MVRACARRFLRRNSWHHSAFSPRNSKQFPQSQFDMPWMVSVRSSPLSRFRCCILAAEFFGGFHFFEPLGTESAPKSYRIYRDKPRPLVPGRAFAAPAAFRLGVPQRRVMTLHVVSRKPRKRQAVRCIALIAATRGRPCGASRGEEESEGPPQLENKGPHMERFAGVGGILKH